MADNKIVLSDGTTLIDLSNDTVTEQTLPQGVTAHDRAGNPITGTMKVQNYRSGTSEPDDSMGGDGDLYFMTKG